MKHGLPTLLFIGLVSVAQAQLLNGSFEINGQGSLDDWNNSCSQGVLVPGGAPGCGDWHAGYPTQMYPGGCNGTHDLFYQELPWLAPDYQNVTIGFWARTNTAFDPEYFIAIDVRLSHIHDGVFFPSLNGGGAVLPSVDWTYHTMTITNPNQFNPIHPTDTRAIGFVGIDTTGTELLELDGLEVLSVNDISTGLVDIDPLQLLGFHDPVNDIVVITHSTDDLVLCIDGSGRRVHLPLMTNTNGARTYNTAALALGLYTVASGSRSLRFIKQ
jgi:hypothetical protein